jgi:hypothetical protein
MRWRRYKHDTTATANNDSDHCELQPDERRSRDFHLRNRDKFEWRDFSFDWRSCRDNICRGERDKRNCDGTERSGDGKNFDCDAAGNGVVGQQLHRERGSSDDYGGFSDERASGNNRNTDRNEFHGRDKREI